jgi:hypothetical protein
LLGWKNGAQLSRYEKRHTLPPLRTALAFEAIFKVPLAELFAGLRQSVAHETSDRIEKLTARFETNSDPKRQRHLGRKRAWIAERRAPVSSSTL